MTRKEALDHFMSKLPQRDMLLLETLSIAVPMRIAQLKADNQPSREYLEQIRAPAGTKANGITKLLIEKGDLLMYGGGKKGEVTEVFNALVEIISVCAFQPGGCKFLKLHWNESGES